MTNYSIHKIIALLLPFALIAQDGTVAEVGVDTDEVVGVVETTADDSTSALPEIAFDVTSDVVELDSDELLIADAAGGGTAGLVDVEILDASSDPIVEVPFPGEAGDATGGVDVMPVITEVVDVLPSDTEIVLDLPGSEDGSATMADEEKISVDFPDEDIRNILLNVAELFDLNLVIPDSLQGRASIKFKNVSWRVVYTEALRPLGYTFEEDRNIVRVVSFEEQAIEPPDTRVFIINYATAADIQGSISPLIDTAAGGRIQVDTRSNALVITERPSRMNKIQDILERLDRPTHQVMVEAKFIEVLNQDIKNLGVNWASLDGYGLSAGPFNRTYTKNYTSDRDGSGSFSSDLGTTVTTPPGPPGVVDSTTLASAVQTLATASATGRFDTAVFNADQFNVVLSALTTNRESKLVSNPTVVVMNNEPATFEVGQDYPIREVTFNQETGTYEAGEVTKEFIGIGIKVTPSVNAAGMINLEVNPKISSLDGTVESLGAVDPIIGKREAVTRVTVKDGYTLALGGLSETIVANAGNKVPLLGDTPFIKRLFRSKADDEQNRNLIVFVTSKTLNPDGSTYKEVIDPRVIHDMGIQPSEIPGYKVPSEEIELYEKLNTMTAEIEAENYQNKIETKIDLLRKSKEVEAN